MCLCVNVWLLLQFLIDSREVGAHQGALIGLWATRVDKRQCECFATILRQVYSLPILIRKTKVGNIVAGFWLTGNLGGR